MAGSFAPIIIKQVSDGRQYTPLVNFLDSLNGGKLVIGCPVAAGKKLFESAFGA